MSEWMNALPSAELSPGLAPPKGPRHPSCWVFSLFSVSPSPGSVFVGLFESACLCSSEISVLLHWGSSLFNGSGARWHSQSGLWAGRRRWHVFQTLPDPAEFKHPPGRRNDNCSEPKLPPRPTQTLSGNPPRECGVWWGCGVISGTTLTGTTPQGALSWGDRWQSLRWLRGVGKSCDSQTSQSHGCSFDTFPNDFTDCVADIIVFEETAGCCGKWNSCLAVRQGILLLSLVSWCVCVCVCVFSEENCMWFLRQKQVLMGRSENLSVESLQRDLTLTFDWGSPATLRDSSGQCFGN